ncbi:MAG: S-layer homology domain-containing protein, partial [Oscillospiraceae bacterium]|nr:S-layer homology domain-containing protein [Oscillospiraceae bacterium]
YPVIGADSIYANVEGNGRIAINHEPYTDVSSGDWFADYVAALSYEGVIGGMTATTYEPNGTLTNGQALALLMRAHGEEVAQGTGADWAAGYIEKAVELGLTEEPLVQDEAISRGEFCDIAAKLYGLTGAPEQNKFTDTDDAEVLALVAAGVIDGFAEADGTYTFRADDSLLRSQIAKIIYCLNLAA